MTRHVAVWLDHTEAHLYEIARDSFQRSTIKAHGDARQHHKAGSIGDGRHASNEAFYHAVAAGLAGAREIYLCGPGMAKTEFQKHAERHDPGVVGRIVKVESCDHPSDNQIAASARRFFKAFERATPLDQA
jgi:stalled ribosome rescue protein Dom34